MCAEITDGAGAGICDGAGAAICDGAGAGICDGAQSTCSSFTFPKHYHYQLLFSICRQKSYKFPALIRLCVEMFIYLN